MESFKKISDAMQFSAGENEKERDFRNRKIFL